MTAAQATAPLIGSPRASIDLDPYVSQLRTWLDSANDKTALEQLQHMIKAIMRLIERLIARLAHLFGMTYYGLRQGIRGEVMDVTSLPAKEAEPVAAEFDRGALQGASFSEALAAVDRQISHLVEHVVSGDAHRAGDYADPERLDAILQDFARSRLDFGVLANRAQGDVDRLLPEVIAFIQATGGNADPRVVLDILAKGPSDPQARTIDRSGHLVKAIADNALALERVRGMEIAAHALVQQAGEHSPALQARMRARALALMPGALEFLEADRRPAQGTLEVPSAQDVGAQQTDSAQEKDAYILQERKQFTPAGDETSAQAASGAQQIAAAPGGKVSGFARFARHVDLPDESLFDAVVEAPRSREVERERL
jgi:hypothetical protein